MTTQSKGLLNQWALRRRAMLDLHKAGWNYNKAGKLFGVDGGNARRMVLEERERLATGKEPRVNAV